MNFDEVRRAQSSKSTLLTTTLVPLGRFFKICSDAKQRVGCGKQWEAAATYSIPGKIAALVPEFTVEDLPSVDLQPKFLHLQ